MELSRIINELLLEDDIDEQDFSLLSGRLSKALLLENLHQGEYQKKILSEIELALEYVNENEVDSSFVSGLAGFGWGVNFILRNGNHVLSENGLLSVLDDFLAKTCIQSIKRKEFEFFYGTVGYLIYFMERSRSSDEAIKYLEELSILFLNSLDYNLASLNQLASNGRIDLSITHGFAGILSVLGKLSKKGLHSNLCYEKIDLISAFIRTKTLRKNSYLIVPDSIEKGNMHFSPLRWCHGQLGITMALSQNLDILNNSTIDNILHELSVTLSLIRNDVSQELVTPAFCHGTFGVAHTLKHIFNNTKDDSLPEAIDYWYDCSYKLLNMQSKGKYLKDTGKRASGLLNGIEGIGMMILDHEQRLKYNGWDESLLF